MRRTEEGELKTRRTRRWRIALLIVVVILLVPLLYFVVIPRTEITLKVYYHESVLNQIDVDTELRNGGTLTASDIELGISVVNSTDFEMGKKEYSPGQVSPFSAPKKLDALTFRGNQYEKYTIIIDLEFSSGGKTYTLHWSHSTEEPWMNQDFTDTVSGF